MKTKTYDRNDYNIKLRLVIKKILKLAALAKEIGVPNISQNGIIKELIIGKELNHIVNSAKHSNDAWAGQINQITISEDGISIEENSTEKVEYSSGSLSLKGTDNPKFQLDRVSSKDDVQSRYKNIDTLILCVFLTESPLLLLYAISIELPKKKTEREKIYGYMGFKIGSSNHTGFMLPPKKIYNCRMLKNRSKMIYDIFREKCIAEINGIRDSENKTGRQYYFTYKLGERRAESSIIYSSTISDQVFSLNTGKIKSLYIVFFGLKKGIPFVECILFYDDIKMHDDIKKRLINNLKNGSGVTRNQLFGDNKWEKWADRVVEYK